VRKAVTNVVEQLAPRLKGMDSQRQAEIDMAMKELDGTPNKSKLGANAILGVSMAVARATAASSGRPLYQSLAETPQYRMPVPMMNIINGGAHADNSLDIQEFMIVPHGAPRFSEALRYGVEVFQALKGLLHRRGFSTAVGDEGGFAPPLGSNEAALDMIVEAIGLAGLRPGTDVSLALDPAANSFTDSNGYNLNRTGVGVVSPPQLLAMYETWVNAYPIVAIEDGFNEDDWENFQAMTAGLGQKIQIIGDDIYVTNETFIERGIKECTTNAALIKLNQIGTVSETIAAINLCQQAGWKTVISHRSGETEDTFIADLSVATAAGQIKAGSLCRGERIAKYNRLLEIERELGSKAVFQSPFPPTAIAS
jgi:enolase